MHCKNLKMNKIILGTAQFGLKYGYYLNNPVTLSNIRRILEHSKKKKIKLIDTADFYGNAIENLSKCNLDEFKIITKIKIKENFDREEIKIQVNKLKRQLEILKKNSFESILIHNTIDLLKFDKKNLLFVDSFLKLIKKKNLAKKVGFSIYIKKEFFFIISKFNFDIIQLPISIVDRRFLEKKIISHIKKKKIEIHGRSLFLQGTLLDKNILKKKFLKKVFLDYNNFIEKNKLDRKTICINFINNIKFLWLGKNA